ncbi:MAG: Gfo/Idh/MocA family oxidoreductase [Alphaproteobacteria bacterium]|nr:Gfo/Idh/MocA family oxidoreductase [Alphaproteobacteria bacterium]MBV9370143.1 Gfo/Idh/MocA family oxidoreductase [Alphaproteobacteria bacterium]MBV9901483.1 Gfo/Idh/MocA family oxidoreductase [Alphaproteobacteria bacterium]
MSLIRVGIVGYGKIAQDQHVPSIEGDPRFVLAATVSRGGNGHPGIPCFPSHTAMLEGAELDAVAICTPPSVRYDIARDCLLAGKHALLEKPPGISLGEVEALARLAETRKLSLFTTWHAQHNAAVPAAAALLADRTIASMRITWREDVRKWHPGQQWIWEPGGFGVFDPGINALSIATRIVPATLFVRDAQLFFPANRQAPIAARLRLASPASKGAIEAEFDWRHEGGEAWDIEVETADGERIRLAEGGSKLSRGGAPVAASGPGEYPSIYAAFAALVDAKGSHVDLAPLRLTAEAFMLGRRTQVEPFEG